MKISTILYKPFGIATGVLGGAVAGALVKSAWKRVAGEEDAPSALQREYRWGEVLAAAALQGLVFAVVKAAVDRGGATVFHRLTGTWPGD